MTCSHAGRFAEDLPTFVGDAIRTRRDYKSSQIGKTAQHERMTEGWNMLFHGRNRKLLEEGV